MLNGIIIENQYKVKLNEMEIINNIDELSNYLKELVDEYVNETEIVAGSGLEWDEATKGISKEELVKDFIGHLQEYL